MTEKETLAKRGFLERFLTELLKSPKFRTEMKMFFSSIDPENAPGVVRTLMWSDAETFFGFLGALPNITNWLLQMLREMGAQLATIPDEMFKNFVYQLLSDIDGRTMGEMAGGFRKLLAGLQGQEAVQRIGSAMWSDAKAGFAADGGEPAGGGLLVGLAEGVGKAMSANPELVAKLAAPIVEGFRQAAAELETASGR